MCEEMAGTRWLSLFYVEFGALVVSIECCTGEGRARSDAIMDEKRLALLATVEQRRKMKQNTMSNCYEPNVFGQHKLELEISEQQTHPNVIVNLLSTFTVTLLKIWKGHEHSFAASALKWDDDFSSPVLENMM